MTDGLGPRQRQAATTIAAAALIFACCAASSRTLDYTVAAGGWQYERFGDDVTILHARTSNKRDQAGEIGLFFSCDGGDRRLRLTFPKPQGASFLRSRAGFVLIRPIAGASPMKGVVMSFTAIDRFVVLLNEPPLGTGSAVAEILRMFGAAPRGIDILHTSAQGAALGSVGALRLAVEFKPSDDLTFQQVGRACTPVSSIGNR